MYYVYKLQFQTYFHCYMIANTQNNLQKQQRRQVAIAYYAFYKVNIVFASCTVEYLYVVCELLNNGQ